MSSPRKPDTKAKSSEFWVVGWGPNLVVDRLAVTKRNSYWGELRTWSDRNPAHSSFQKVSENKFSLLSMLLSEPRAARTSADFGIEVQTWSCDEEDIGSLHVQSLQNPNIVSQVLGSGFSDVKVQQAKRNLKDTLSTFGLLFGHIRRPLEPTICLLSDSVPKGPPKQLLWAHKIPTIFILRTDVSLHRTSLTSLGAYLFGVRTLRSVYTSIAACKGCTSSGVCLAMDKHQVYIRSQLHSDCSNDSRKSRSFSRNDSFGSWFWSLPLFRAPDTSTTIFNEPGDHTLGDSFSWAVFSPKDLSLTTSSVQRCTVVRQARVCAPSFA